MNTEKEMAIVGEAVRSAGRGTHSYSAPIPPHYIKQFIHYLYKTPRRLLI